MKDSKFLKSCNVRKYLRTIFTGLSVGTFALVWWLVFYPELCLPRDVYEVLYEQDMYDMDGEDLYSEEEIWNQLLQADGERVIVKSRLLEWLQQHKN